MKRIAAWALFCSLFLFICSCETTGQKEKSIALETEKDSVSYVIGANMARSLMDIKDEISLDVLIRGMKDWFNEKWDDLSRGGKHFEGYMKHITKSGKDLWTMSTYTCVRTPEGGVEKGSTIDVVGCNSGWGYAGASKGSSTGWG